MVSWGQFGRTAAATGDNPLEVSLTPASVPRLSEAWHRSLPGPAAVGPPVEWNRIVFVSGTHIHAYGMGLGRERWHGGHWGELAVARGVLYSVSEAVARPSHLLQVRIWAYDATTGRHLWTVTTPVRASTDVAVGSPAVSGNTLYVGETIQIDAAGRTAGRTLAFNARTGALRWMARHGGAGAKPVVANGRVYSEEVDGLSTRLFVLSARTRRVESVIGGGEELMAAGPVRLFVGGSREVVTALPAAGCESQPCDLWSRSIGHIDGLALTSTALYVADLGSGGGTDGELLALRTSTGAVRWSAVPPDGDGGFTGVSVAGRVVYATTPYHVVAYPAACTTPCRPIWQSRRSSPAWVRGPAIVANGEIVYTSGQGNGPVAYRLP